MTLSGWKKLSFTATESLTGGVPALALNVTGVRPATVAVTTWTEAAPSVRTVWAMPLESVESTPGVRLLPPPLPVTIAQSTRTPGTVLLLASVTVTLKAMGSALLWYHDCPSPPAFATRAGGPGGVVVSELQAKPRRPPTTAARRTHMFAD